MEHTSATVERVQRLDVRGEHEDVDVELGDGSRLILSRKHRDFDFLLDRLRADMADRSAAYVEFDATARSIEDVRVASASRIRYLAEEPENGRLRVVPLRAAAPYFLRMDHPRYGEWRTLLERALSSGEPLLMAKAVGSYQIVYVREPLPEIEPAPEGTPTSGGEKAP